ncbi:EAL domain-containing protein [Devosia algicola]|uniref:EAL domain-containing protein n=1 Tax=Devosia algicola TaxID=3026418 RepID=A0ABY7YMK2_9HYPH|nr:EAL domain-containing protein [Devosia algicola]WDR02534.1 EAL domain-containing protein [Devosia algicola]
MHRRRGLEVDLRRGLANGQFQLYYQPLISLQSMKIVSGEALLRWNHPVHGSISPAEFIPLAEETGFIDDLGEWAMQQALRDASNWPDNVRVSVNLSPVQFRDSTLARRVQDMLVRSGMAPGRVELEITESVLLHDSSTNLETLRQLSALGCPIALDDFGTGFSSLSYLLRFPFNKIKIDQSFVRGLEDRGDRFAIVQSVAQLAKRLNMTTTAEGVETLDQLNIVREADCTEAQGYYFNRPLPEHEFHALVRAEATGPDSVGRRLNRSKRYLGLVK